ncbi:MAG: nitrite reductase small subunit NirD [Alphaproteobacteria bacterium]|nr:nitrite reductase small subunit NirD [Alphaproteobacteria bacterium]
MSVDMIDIGRVDDVPLRGARLVQTAMGPLAIFRAEDGALYAVDDRCPHKLGPLSQGIVHGHHVTCPLHNLVIDLRSGEALGPEGGCVKTYPIEARAGRILLDVSALRRRGAA